MASRYRHRRSQALPLPSPSLSRPILQCKFTTLLSRHEEMKVSYHQLKSQINASLLEVDEVFASLAIPLMKLVGLKTAEMAEEGRFTTIIIDPEVSHESQSSGLVLESRVADEAGKGYNQISAFEGESYANKAIIVSKELMEKQQTKLIQFVHLLRQIETKVNAHQDGIFETLGNQRVALHKVFQRAIHCIDILYNQNQDTFPTTLKLLQAIFNIVSTVLGSIEDRVEGLIRELSKHMCKPMMEFCKDLNNDVKNGPCVRLLAMVDEMGRMMTEERLELEDARQKARVAEQGRIEALHKLQAMEERVRTTMEHLRISQAKRGHLELPCLLKLLGMEEDQAKDDKLLWELLNKKRKYQAPESPMGPEGLTYCGTNSKRYKSTQVRPAMTIHRPVTSCMRDLSPQTPCPNTWIPLGASPSVPMQPIVPRKRISPQIHP